jgi:ABC-2 type transport system permease protein
MKKMKNISSIIKAELNLIIEDHSILLTVIIAPLLYAFFLGTIYIKKDIDRISFAVVDMDNSATTMKLTRLLSASSKVDVKGKLHSYEEAIDLMYQQKITGFLMFPSGFEKELLTLEGADVKMYLNTTRFLPSNDLNKAISTVMLTAGSGVRLRFFSANGINPKIGMELINPILPEVRAIYNPTNNYGDFLLPGLLFLILQQTLLIGMGESVAKDNELGKLDGYLRKKNGILDYILGKPAYYLFLYFSYFMIFFFGVYQVFGLHVTGNIVALFTVGMIFVLVLAVMAILFGTFIKSQIRYMEIMAFTTYPFFLTSGYSWPVTAMPEPLQWLAQIIPTTHFLHAGTRLVVMGGTWHDVAADIYKLMILFGVFTLLTVWRLWTMKRKGAERLSANESLVAI